MADALAPFVTALHELGWPAQADPARGRIRLGVNCANGQFVVAIEVDTDHELVRCLVAYPVRISPADRAAVVEYLTRVNFGLPAGNFEMNYADGEVRFRASLPTAAGALNVAAARHLVQQSLATADHYVNGLLQVEYGNVSPIEALREADSPSESEPAADEAAAR
ncbi:MAG: YbjN domain-containing protein [Hymenobacteraceae bacterium]|nr:YbjN domain-containing protein [Hymenobacteraceae bacterium]